MNPRTWAKLFYVRCTVQTNRTKEPELCSVLESAAPGERGELCRSLMRDGLRYRDSIAGSKPMSSLWDALTRDQQNAVVAVSRGFAAHNDAVEKLA